LAISLEKIGLVRRAAKLLAELDWGDVNLIIKSLNLPPVTYQDWNDDPDGRWFVGHEDKQNLLKSQMSELSIPRLQEAILASESILGESFALSVPDAVDRPLALFASHLSTEKIIVQEVAKHLEGFGINVFVAHETIAPSTEWQVEIERSLAASHGALAFIHPGFDGSDWCNQEMGWVKGRGIPFLMFLFDNQHPKGMLAKTQGQKVSSTTGSLELSKLVLKWLGHNPEFSKPLDESAILALSKSKSFEMTDKLWGRVLKMDELNESQITKILNALSTNDQFFSASCRALGSGEDYGKPYTKAALKFLHQFPEFDLCRSLAEQVSKEHGVQDYLEQLDVPF
jgi:hypothetical protein